VRKVQKRILIGLSSSEAVGVSPWQRDRMGWHRFCSLLGFCCRVPPKLAFEMSARPRNGARLSQCYFYALSLSLSLSAQAPVRPAEPALLTRDESLSSERTDPAQLHAQPEAHPAHF